MSLVLLAGLASAAFRAASAPSIHAPAAPAASAASMVRPALAAPLAPAVSAPSALTPVLSAPAIAVAPSVEAQAPAAMPQAEAMAASFAEARGAQSFGSSFNSAYDGSPSGARGPLGTDAVDTAGLPEYLTVADSADRARVAAAVRAAERSPTAKRVLGAVARLAAAQGRPVPVYIGGTLGGEFDYDTEVVGIGKRYRGRSPSAMATVLVHELQHVLQKSKGLPGDALELELEAYLIDFTVHRELGVKPRPGSWDERAQAKFAEGVKPFMTWLLKEYGDNIPLIGSSVDAYDAVLAEHQKKAERAIARHSKSLAKTQAILADMERTGQRPAAIAAYRDGVVAGFAGKLREAQVALDWAKRDRALLRRPVSRKRYQDFARRVHARAKALQKKWAAESSR